MMRTECLRTRKTGVMAKLLNMSKMALDLMTSGLRLDGAQLAHTSVPMVIGTITSRVIIIGVATPTVEDIH